MAAALWRSGPPVLLLTLPLLGVAPAPAKDIVIHRHGLHMAPPEKSYDETVVDGIRFYKPRPVPVTVTRPEVIRPRTEGSGVMKALKHPELLEAAAKQAGSRFDATLERITTAYLSEIRLASMRHRVPAELILGVIVAESAGDPKAVSPKGAQGLMQLMPETAKSLGVGDPFDPAANVDGGTRLLSELIDQYEGDPVLVLAAYNAGPAAVEKHGGVPPYDETRDYIPKVLNATAAARRWVE